MPHTPESSAPRRLSARLTPARSLPLTPVRYRNIPEQIATALRQAIAEGSLRPGSRLFESQIAEQMGTSRAPVREALAHLVREGLVVHEPNRGARIVDLTEQTMREVASLRSLLEGFAATLAAGRLTAEQLAELDALVAGMDEAARQGEFARLIELDYRFHDFICRGAGHQTLHEAWSAMSGKVRLFLSTTNLMYRNLRGIGRGHQAIVAALRTRSPVQARRAMEAHLVGGVLKRFVSTVIRRDQPARPSHGRKTQRRRP